MQLLGTDAWLGSEGWLGPLRAKVERVAPRDVTVLIQGETGTGKTTLAREVWRASKRAAAPFVAVDCTLLLPTLAESQLFGHTRGAFTGAVADHAGHVAAADGGTLFLDEVGDLGLEVQAKLLRLIDEGTFVALGSTREQRANVRFIAATHRPLERLVDEGRFRRDLFHRLAVVELEIPPLRARIDDLPLLIDAFRRRITDLQGEPPPTFSTEALAILGAHAWEGNVRELWNLMLGLAAMLPGSAVAEVEHLPGRIRSAQRLAARLDALADEDALPAGREAPEASAEADEVDTVTLDLLTSRHALTPTE